MFDGAAAERESSLALATLVEIEHAGWSYRRGSITRVEQRASARLVAYLARRMHIPIDRRHIIGHADVRHPSGRGWGGVDHHTDPGPYWNWSRYLRLVRHFAKNPQRPRFRRVVPSTGCAETRSW